MPVKAIQDMQQQQSTESQQQQNTHNITIENIEENATVSFFSNYCFINPYQHSDYYYGNTT